MHEFKKKNVTLIALLFNLWLKAKVGYTTLGLLRCIKVVKSNGFYHMFEFFNLKAITFSSLKHF